MVTMVCTSQEQHFSCPRPEDPQHFTDCCGPSWERKCCARLTSRTQEDIEHLFEGTKNVINFLGIITAVVILVVAVVLVCCCCTPCCLLAKRRRRRGMVSKNKVVLLQSLYFCNFLG